MNVAAIINPLSGAGAIGDAAARRIAWLREHLRGLSHEATIAVTGHAGHARELAMAARADGASLVIVWGGDGTVNEVASALIGGTAALAIVPSGSGNGLAAALGVPREPGAAVEVALRGEDRIVDAGEIGGRPFFNIAGVGFDAVVARRFNARPLGRRGLGPYLRIGVHEACRYRAQSYRIDLDGERIDSDALLVAFANGREYGNGARLAPHARIDDGRLEAVVVTDRGVVQRLWSGRHLALGTAQRARGVVFRSIERASVAADARMCFHVDGEVEEREGTLDVRVLPAALRVRAPRDRVNEPE